ncbi:unnamed protein product [Caretta caretta]
MYNSLLWLHDSFLDNENLPSVFTRVSKYVDILYTPLQFGTACFPDDFELPQSLLMVEKKLNVVNNLSRQLQR